MPKQLGSALSIVLTFFVTLALNTALNFYTSDKGAIGVSRAILLNGKYTSVISIENYSREFLEGIAIEVPIAVATSDVVADAAVSLQDVPGTAQARTRLVRINQVPPRVITRLFVPSPDAATAQLVRVTNSDASGLSLRKDDELESPLRRALFTGLVVALMYALFAAGTTYYANRAMKPLQNRTDALEEQIKVTRRRVNELEARETKARLLLQARLADYARELEFWRNAIRSLLHSGKDERGTADRLIAQVTASLKTFGATPIRQFDAVRVAAAWLAEAESKAAEVSRQHAAMGQAKGSAGQGDAV